MTWVGSVLPDIIGMKRVTHRVAISRYFTAQRGERVAKDCVATMID
jgi:hypothetical protein